MQKKKTVKKDSKKKKFLFIDLELFFANNIKLIFLVFIAVFSYLLLLRSFPMLQICF